MNHNENKGNAKRNIPALHTFAMTLTFEGNSKCNILALPTFAMTLKFDSLVSNTFIRYVTDGRTNGTQGALLFDLCNTLRRNNEDKNTAEEK